MAERTYTVTNRIIFREYEVLNWRFLPYEELQHFFGFSLSMEFLPEKDLLKITLVLDSDNDDKVDTEFQDFLSDNGFVEISNDRTLGSQFPRLL